ncbi:MAG: tetratricopeptide repeat protein [Candidatus Acidiferrum sp.]
MSERKRILLLLGVAVLVYANTLLSSFAMDDELYIFRNSTVTSLSLSKVFEPTKANNVFRPITFGSLALNWALGSVHPFGYHLFNLLLNAAVTVLVYLVLRNLLEPLAQGTIVAWVAALLFAVHPIHTEAVAAIVGRSELLAAGFLLGAWLLHLHDRPVLVLICFILALLSKESAVVFVPLVVAGDYARGKLKPLSRYGWITGMAVAYLVVLWNVQGGRFGEKAINYLDNPLAYLPARLRIPNALRIAWKYLGLQFYPGTLSCDYSYNAILLYANWHRTILAVVAFVLVMTLWLWALYTKRKEWFLAGAIYLAGFSITANVLVPTGTIMAERLAYLPSVGFCLFIALIWICLEERNRKVAWVVLSLIVLALATRTVVRNRDWHDNFRLFTAGVRAVPGSAKMHAGLGEQYMERGQLDEARNELGIALRIFPMYPQAIGVAGVVESHAGHDQEALHLFEKELSMTGKDNIDYPAVQVTLAAQLMKLKQNDKALGILDEVIASAPGNARAWSNRAVIRFQRGEQATARSDAEIALRLDPNSAQAQDLLSVLNSSGPPVRQP